MKRLLLILLGISFAGSVLALDAVGPPVPSHKAKPAACFSVDNKSKFDVHIKYSFKTDAANSNSKVLTVKSGHVGHFASMKHCGNIKFMKVSATTPTGTDVAWPLIHRYNCPVNEYMGGNVKITNVIGHPDEVNVHCNLS